MTVSSTNTKNSYSGDGSTAEFNYTFKVIDDDDITVIIRTNATGDETVKSKGTHYTVSGVGNDGGGAVTFTAGNTPASTETVVLLRDTAQTQTTDYTPNDPFPASSHENALDKVTFLAQEIQEELDRAIKISRTNTITSSEFTIGPSDRANKIFAFDSNGDFAVTQEIGTYRGTDATVTTTSYVARDLVKSTTTAQLDNVYIALQASAAGTSLTNTTYWALIVDAVTAAQSVATSAASAAAAAASETAAAASETAAATSETNAATSETNAATSATNSANSATASATSASNASTSETNAATSETNALASKTAAANSASAAATSASNSATSASASATSASQSASSASAASTSATNSATSATNSANSASASSTSASNAASSATSASSAQTAAESARDATLAAYDNFDDRYLGTKSSAPTVDNDGDALVAGALYFDSVAGAMYVYTGSAWVAAYVSGTGFLALTGGTMTGDINFGNNDKAIFGAGSALQIYHNGANSYIDDTGTGNLYIRASDTVRLQSATGEQGVIVTTDGAVTLYHDNGAKLATTASGISVTGSVVSDGLTMDGNITQSGAGTKTISLERVGASKLDIGASTAGVGNFITTTTNDLFVKRTASSTKVLGVGNSTGDISFYDSTGVTQGFLWDASTQRLGLGNTSPQKLLHLQASGGTTARFQSTGARVWDIGNDATTITAFVIDDVTAGQERFRITSDGSIGIGSQSPSQKLTVEGTANNQNSEIKITAAGVASGYLGSNSDGLNIGTDSHGIVFKTGVTGGGSVGATGSERMRILAGGGITFNGDTAAANALDDYEEGTWIPDPQDSSGNSGSVGTVAGNYTKVGNVVLATFYLEDINTSGLTAGQDIRIYGLPFTAKSIAQSQFFTGDARLNYVTFSGNPNLAILDNTSYMRILESNSGAVSDFVTVSQVASGTADIQGSITYMASG